MLVDSDNIINLKKLFVFTFLLYNIWGIFCDSLSELKIISLSFFMACIASTCIHFHCIGLIIGNHIGVIISFSPFTMVFVDMLIKIIVHRGLKIHSYIIIDIAVITLITLDLPLIYSLIINQTGMILGQLSKAMSPFFVFQL